MSQEIDYYRALVQEIGKKRIRELRKLYRLLSEKTKTLQMYIDMAERYKDLIEHVPEAIFQITIDGTFLNLNLKMAYLLGFDSPEELIDKNLSIFDFSVNPEDRKRFANMIEKQGRVDEFQIDLRKKDGRMIRVRISAETVSDEKQGLPYCYGTCESIKHNDFKSQSPDGPKSEMLSALVHKLSNIFFLIKNSATQYLVEVPGSQTVKKYLDSIASACEEAELILGNLILPKEDQFHFEPVEISEVIKRAEPSLRRSLPAHIELEISHLEKGLIVMGDKEQLSRLLLNLVVESKDAIPEDGKLTVRAFSDQIDGDLQTRHSYETKGQYAVIELCYKGSGIQKDLLSSIFEPLTWIREMEDLTEMGLNQIWTTIRNHKGYIIFTETPENGMCLKIYIPRIYTTISVEEKKTEDMVEKMRKVSKILIVGSNPEVRSFIKEALSFEGYEIIETFPGQEMELALRQNSNVDLVIVDVQIVERDCFSLYERSIRINNRLKFLFLTTYPEEIKGALPHYVSYEVVAKPLSYDVLVSKIKEIVKDKS